MGKSFPEHILSRKIKISQPEKGYRFSLDPFILAAHIQAAGTQKIIDIGCGCGIMPLLLALKNPNLHIIGVEIQKELYEFARRNSIDNTFGENIQIFHKDIKKTRLSDINGRADIIISNPPYIKKGSGRLNPDSRKAIARHEITLDIEQFFQCASRLLHKNGKVYVIFPADRLSDLLDAMEHHKFSPEFLRHIHIKEDEPPKRIIACAVKEGAASNSNKPCVMRPPFFVYTAENSPSEEYAAVF